MVARLIEWLADHEQFALRRAFVVWLKRVLLPARVPGGELPPINDLQEMHAMLAERVKTWTEDWKQQGFEQGIEQGIPRGEARLLRCQILRRFGTIPDWADRRRTGASLTELDTWGERLLDADTLDDVFRSPL